jgi:hypothetical protein
VNPAWVAALVALASAIITLLYWIVRRLWRMFQRTDDFLEDWNGRPATRGHPARPGVMERLVMLEENHAAISKRLDAQDQSLNVIKDEVTFNHGHSLKDTVRQILDRLNGPDKWRVP